MKLLMFAVLILFCITSGFPENKENVKELPAFEYYQGNIVAESLPYYRKFVITGSTNLRKGTADAVELTVYYGSKNDKQTQYWFRPKNSATEEFRIVVDKLKKMKKYTFVFKFFSNPLVKKSVLERTLKDTIDEILIPLKNQGSVPIKDYQKKFNEKIKKELKESMFLKDNFYKIDKDGNREFLKKIDTQNECIPDPGLEFPDDIKEKFFKAASNEDTVASKPAELNVKLEKFNQYKSDNSTKIDELKKKLKALAKDNKQCKADYDNLIIAIDDPIKIDPKKLENFDEDHWPEEIRDNIILKEIRSYCSQIYSVNDSIEESKKELKELYSQKGGSLNTWLSEEIATRFQDIHVLSSFGSFDTESANSNADIDKLFLSAIFGYGLGIFSVKSDVAGSSTDTETDWFAYLGIKIRPVKVDRSVEKPFPNLISRFSLTLGAVFNSKVSFKGQEQLHAFAGLMPTIGINADFSRYFGINLGILLFRQPNINPFVKDDYGVKASFFFGVTYDIDVFNMLIDLFKKNM